MRTADELMGLLRERPALAEAIRRDVVACGGPDGEITRCESLVFDRQNDQAWCCYRVEITGDPDEYGSSVEVTDEDYAVALALGLDAKTLGFE